MKLIAKAPLRISLYGGGSDTGEFLEKYGGVVINMAINIRQEFEFGQPSTTGNVYDYPPTGSINFYQAFFEEFDYFPGYMKQKFDGFIHGGLGSSASAAVCLVAALSRLKGQELTREEIAEKAWDIEVNKLGLFGGKQDQYAAAFGGFNMMKFGQGFELYPFGRKYAEMITKHLVLFDTGTRRKDPKIQEGLKKITVNQAEALGVLKNIANDAYHRVYKHDIKGLGKLLDESWTFKKLSNNVSTSEIDEIYTRAISLGAYGGKLCGSGGGGYMIFICPQEKREELITKLGIKWVDFSPEINGVETRII